MNTIDGNKVVLEQFLKDLSEYAALSSDAVQVWNALSTLCRVFDGSEIGKLFSDMESSAKSGIKI